MLLHLWMPIVLALAAILTSGQSLKDNKGQVFETESAYNYIQVQELNGFMLLRLNDGQGIHSIYHPDTLAIWRAVGTIFSWAVFLCKIANLPT